MLTVIHDVAVVTMDRVRRVIRRGAIALLDDRIVAVEPGDALLEAYPDADRFVDGRGKVAMPGIINAHTHMTQSLQRGLSDDLDLLVFLRDLAYPFAQALEPRHVGVGARLACLEALRTGTTCIVDNLTGDLRAEAVRLTVQAMVDSGIRGVVAVTLSERTPRCDKWQVPAYVYTQRFGDQLAVLEELVQSLHEAGNGRVSLCPAPVTCWTTTPESFLAAHQFAEKYDLLLHTHVAEATSEVEASLEDYGQREVELLHSLGVLDHRFMVVHGVWLSDGEIELLAESGASVIHCPTSNMYLASGVARVPELREAGVAVALGSDGIGNHNHDMFSTFGVASLLQKVAHRDPRLLPAEQVLEMATLDGARALGLEASLGSLEAGKKADVVLVQLDSAHLMPVHRLPSALVYGAHGCDVDMVIIDGRIVVEQGIVTSLDGRAVIDEASEVATHLVRVAKLEQLADRPWKGQNRD